MPGCCVVGCSKNTKRRDDVSFHHFPKDKDTRLRWVTAISRENLPDRYAETAYVCSDHFLPEDFERNLQAELTKKAHRPRLKAGAVPSVFPHKPPPAKRRKSQYQERKEHEEVSSDYVQETSQSCWS